MCSGERLPPRPPRVGDDKRYCRRARRERLRPPSRPFFPLVKPSPAASQASSAPQVQGDPGPFLPAQVLRGRPGLRRTRPPGGSPRAGRVAAARSGCRGRLVAFGWIVVLARKERRRRSCGKANLTKCSLDRSDPCLTAVRGQRRRTAGAAASAALVGSDRRPPELTSCCYSFPNFHQKRLVGLIWNVSLNGCISASGVTSQRPGSEAPASRPHPDAQHRVQPSKHLPMKPRALKY